MVFYCCVRGCNNNSDNTKQSKDITFHEFPSEQELRKNWLQAIGHPEWDPPSYIRICSSHFDINDISGESSNICIKEEAYPVNMVNNLEGKNVEVCRICLATNVKMFNFQYGVLKLCIEALAKINEHYKMEDLPQFICYECKAELLKYHKFIEKSMVAQTTLLKILKDNGKITKHLIEQTDRKLLKLQSCLGYPTTDAVIALVGNYEDRNSNLDDLSDSSDEMDTKTSKMYANSSKNIKEIYFKRSTNKSVRFNQKSKKIKNNNDPIKSNRNHKKDSKKSKHSKIYESENPVQNIIEKESFSHVKLNIALKSEVIDETELYGDGKLQYNVENVPASAEHTLKDSDKEIIKPFKVECDSPNYCKVEKGDSEDEDSLSKIKDTTMKLDNCNMGEYKTLEPNTQRRSLRTVQSLPDRESDENSFSSENEDLLRLKNNSKIQKGNSNIKINTSTRRKKAGDKEPPGESAVGKLQCYKIVNLTLEEQINEWKKENEQPTHYRDEVFQCEICTKKFLRKKAYEQHLAYHKPSRGDVVCPVCMERFQSKTRLNAHTTRTHAKRYECTKCPKVLYDLIRARRHEIQHSGQVYKCPHCEYSTRHRSAAWEHTRRQHAHAHHCARCGHAFINGKGLAQHRAVAHPDQDDEPEDPYPCEQCNIVFHSEGALRVHQFTSKLHENPDPPPLDQALKLTCKRCGATFAKRRELWAHAQKLHKWVSRPTLRKRGVPLDRRTCEHCDKEVKTRFEYWCHLRREHPKLKHTYRRIVTAVCDKCGQGFNNASLLKIHSLSHGAATLACARCPRVFHDRHALARHAYCHTPDRPHACTRCARAFKLKGNLERHMRTHTGETPYECSFCGKKFKYWGSMNEHEKHMHQKIPWPPRDRRPAGARRADKLTS